VDYLDWNLRVHDHSENRNYRVRCLNPDCRYFDQDAERCAAWLYTNFEDTGLEA
jgi:hypothetical protein